MRQRTRGSVRFDPYYKLQWFDDTVMAWRDIQRQYASPAEAAGDIGRGARVWRLMEITMHGRHPMPLPAHRAG
jgi:hypothetical protein